MPQCAQSRRLAIRVAGTPLHITGMHIGVGKFAPVAASAPLRAWLDWLRSTFKKILQLCKSAEIL